MRPFERKLQAKDDRYRNKFGHVVTATGIRPPWRDRWVRVLVFWDQAWALYRGRRPTHQGRMWRWSRWMPIMPGDAFVYRITDAAEGTDFTGWIPGYHVCRIRDGKLVSDPAKFRTINP